MLKVLCVYQTHVHLSHPKHTKHRKITFQGTPVFISVQNCLCVTWWVVGSFDCWRSKALLKAHLPLELSFCIRVIRDQSTSLSLSSTGLFDTSTQSKQMVFLHLENSTSEQVHEQNGKMSAYKVHLTSRSNKVWLSQNHKAHPDLPHGTASMDEWTNIFRP